MNKKKVLIFIFAIILLILFLVFLYLKFYNTDKYSKYDEIISFSNEANSEIVFYNVNNDTCQIVNYTLSPSKDKVEQNIMVRKYKSNKEISMEKFKVLLEEISTLTNKQYKLDENNIIKYGGEKVITSAEELEDIIELVDEQTK